METHFKVNLGLDVTLLIPLEIILLEQHITELRALIKYMIIKMETGHNVVLFTNIQR